MKLLTKINRRFALFSALALLFGVLLIYLFMRYFVQANLEENLRLNKLNAVKELRIGHKVEFAPFLEVKEISSERMKNTTDEIKDTLIYNEVEREPDSFCQLKSFQNINGKYYQIIVRQDNVEQEDLIYSIVIPVFILLLLILLISNLAVNRISIAIWKPFYNNLEKLKRFSASDKNKLDLTESGIEEFRDLNDALTELTEKVKADYIKLKEFSENASHELQTPIAIIKAKIEAMMQTEITEEKLAQLHAITKVLNRLSRLNESLTLLTKLDSADFREKKEISLKNFIIRMEEDFSEIADAKDIRIEADLRNDVIIPFNEDLLEILLSNLFANAIKHNLKNGKIFVELIGREFKIKNTGAELQKDALKMFDRFEKDDQSGDSPGLGLTIVKQICDLNGLKVKYSFSDNLHKVEILFPDS